MPDSITVTCRLVGGEVTKVRRIAIVLALQMGDNQFAKFSILFDETIPLDSMWATISWDMLWFKSHGMDSISKIYFAFEFFYNDSCYVGGDIVVNSLRGITGGKAFDIDYFTVTEAPEQKQIPSGFVLEQNYPNPFNPSTTIRYQLSKASWVSLKVFNALGQVVANLVDEEKGPGYYQARWDATLPSGVYFCRFQAGEYLDTKRMILLK